MKTEGTAARFEITSTSILAAASASAAAVIAAVLLVVAHGGPVSWIALVSSSAALTCILCDIAPRRSRSMRAIGRRESTELCRLFVEHSPVYIFLKDSNLKHLLLSRNYETVIGKPLDEMIGKGTDAMFTPEMSRQLDLADRAVLQDGKPVDVINEAGGRVYRTLMFPIFKRGKPAYLAGFTIDVTDQKKAEERALQSLREKDALIRELYHRTKNTLQIIRSMLELQVEEYPQGDSTHRLVKEAEDRIQAIALVHQMLYESRDLSRIYIKDYVAELAALVYRSFGVSEERIALRLGIADLSIALDTAVPIGLILNELMTNSMKHAFPNHRKGIIRVELSGDDAGICVLRYADDGVGVAPDFDFATCDSLGIKLIRSIGEQISGNVSFSGESGVSCTIAFRAGTSCVKSRVRESAVQA